MKRARVLIAITLGVGLTLALVLMLRGPAGSALADSVLTYVPPSLTRLHEPVVITGGLLPNLMGTPLDEVFVYAYRSITPTQIPFQIDERDAAGMYVLVEDGQLDDNDELVFMAMDGGERVDEPSLDAGGALITPTYVITLTDPISDSHAWAYLFHSAELTYSVTTDYVSYDDGNDRIASPGRYALGFDAIHGFLDYLALGDGNQDLLDRSKLRIAGTLFGAPFSANEENVTLDGVRVMDGPVRVTRVSTSTFSGLDSMSTLLAYRSLAVRSESVFVPGDPVQMAHLRLSMDWNERAAGMIYYDANNPAGVTINGVPDVITATPPTEWTQVAGITGTVVGVNRIPAGLGATQSTYYKDDSTIDSDDTGDQRSYGDAGIQVNDPNPGTHASLGHIYFLTGTATNVGGTYVDYYDNPLQVSVAVFTPIPISFTLSVSPTIRVARPGQEVFYSVIVTRVTSFSRPVTLAVEGLPLGVSADWSVNPIAPDGSSILTLSIPSSPPFGDHLMQVVGTAGEQSVGETAELIIDYFKTYLPIVLR